MGHLGEARCALGVQAGAVEQLDGVVHVAADP
jgi:hypothetical protein